MSQSTEFKGSIVSGRISTVLAEWFQQKYKEERLSYVPLNDLYNLFFAETQEHGFKKEDFSLPIFSKVLRKIMHEIGIYNKCSFKRRKTGIIIVGITIALLPDP